MGQPLRVDVAGLRAVGGEVLDQADELTRNVTQATGRLAPGAGPGVAGWAAFAALQTADKGWTQFLTGLSGRTARAGQSLIDAADAYQRADDRAARRHGGPARYQ